MCAEDLRPAATPVPQALRNLSEKAVHALRPLDVDTGEHVRADAGYRVHVAMIKFQWSAVPVKTKIKQLEDSMDKAAARRAFQYLQKCEDSSYKISSGDTRDS